VSDQVRAAENEVIAAAQSTANAYACGGGYTVPLSITLRRLDAAVHAWLAAIAAAALNSDTNGLDRSSGWGEGDNSNGQSQGSNPADTGSSKPSKPCGRSGADSPQTGRRNSAPNSGGPVQESQRQSSQSSNRTRQRCRTNGP
jgi:hypothetical protein